MRVHISLPAKDLEKSRAFYSALFGAAATRVRDDYLNFRLDQPGIHLALVKVGSAAADPHQHYGIELSDADTFAVWEDRAGKVEAAEAIEAEPDAKCCYARAEKVWLTDPDGHRWEIWHRTGEYEALSEPDVACCVESEAASQEKAAAACCAAA
jgi:catechol 2,3-dioxygenase-like lactoylglutathione lyase family enzyme